MEAHHEAKFDSINTLVASKLRNAEAGDEIWMEGRKTPLKIQNIKQRGDVLVFNCSGNGYDYVVKTQAEHGSGVECVRFASRGNSEDLTDDLQGVLHN